MSEWTLPASSLVLAGLGLSGAPLQSSGALHSMFCFEVFGG